METVEKLSIRFEKQRSKSLLCIRCVSVLQFYRKYSTIFFVLLFIGKLVNSINFIVIFDLHRCLWKIEKKIKTKDQSTREKNLSLQSVSENYIDLLWSKKKSLTHQTKLMHGGGGGDVGYPSCYWFSPIKPFYIQIRACLCVWKIDDSYEERTRRRKMVYKQKAASIFAKQFFLSLWNRFCRRCWRYQWIRI